VRATLLSLLILGCLSFACRHRVPATRYDVVDRGSYIYQRLDDGTFAVAARGDLELRAALAEMGCTTTYVCAIEQSGELYHVVQRRK
jgi:hypothetical protein